MKNVFQILLLLAGIVPFVVPVLLGIYQMSIEHWDYLDWLILYSYVYWPTYVAGIILMGISLAGIIHQKTQEKKRCEVSHIIQSSAQPGRHRSRFS